jgi:hypothetical protein
MNNDLPASGAHVRRRFGLSYLRDSRRNVAAGSRLYRQRLAFLDRENIHDAEQILPALDMAVPFLDDGTAVAALAKLGQRTLSRTSLHAERFPNAARRSQVIEPGIPRNAPIRERAQPCEIPSRLAISAVVTVSVPTR